MNLIQLVFSKVGEEDLTLSALKTIQMIAHRLQNNAATSKDQLKQLEKSFHEQKEVLMSRILPSHAAQKDAQIVVKTIQIMISMVNLFPKCLARESIKHVANCVHNGSPAIRHEAANFLLAICSDFDDANSLLAIEKVPKPQADGSAADFSVNFVSEPNKSKKQIQKLINLVKKHVISREDYI